jgi:hypothetical protein
LYSLLVFGLAPLNNLDDTKSMHPSIGLEL